MSESKRRAFAERHARKELVSAPGVFDGVSADRRPARWGEVVRAANIKVE